MSHRAESLAEQGRASRPSELLYNYQRPDEPKAPQYVVVEYSPPTGQPRARLSVSPSVAVHGCCDEGCVSNGRWQT